jgi:hypothetical protein
MSSRVYQAARVSMRSQPMVAPFRFVSVPTLKQVQLFASIGVGVIGLTGLIGWSFQSDMPCNECPGWLSDAARSDSMLLLCGSALCSRPIRFLNPRSIVLDRRRQWFVAFISLITIIQYSLTGPRAARFSQGWPAPRTPGREGCLWSTALNVLLVGNPHSSA